MSNVPPGRYIVRTGPDSRSITHEERKRQPRTVIDFRPTKPGEVLEMELELR